MCLVSSLLVLSSVVWSRRVLSRVASCHVVLCRLVLCVCWARHHYRRRHHSLVTHAVVIISSSHLIKSQPSSPSHGQASYTWASDLQLRLLSRIDSALAVISEIHK